MEIIDESKVKEPQDQKIEEENIELDLDKYGSCTIVQSGNKPIFDKITRVIVKNVVLMTKKERKEDTTKEGQKIICYPVYLNVEFEYKTDYEIKTTFENYGGGKLFVSDKKDQAKFWLGQNSALGKLVQVISDNLEFNGTLKEIPKAIIGCQVGVKTETINVAGTDYSKTVIKQFY